MINVNSKHGGSWLSFSNLRHNQNKENQVSFQNLRRPQTMLNSECSSSRSNPNKKKEQIEKMPLFRNFASKAGLNQTSSVKINSRIKQMSKISPKLSSKDSLESQFNQIQSQIQKRIEEYNSIFNELIQMLTDMQIKDLMKFNGMLKNNKKTYQSASNYSPVEFHKAAEFEQQFMKIKDVEKQIMKALRQPQNSFDFRSTYESKNKKTISPSSSAISPQLANQLHRQDSLQDTPESVKSKLSCVSSKLKPSKVAEIGMFDRINICESIVERVSFSSNSIPVKCKEAREHHRYGRNSEE